jgi:alkanesulfonate monooxygenase SsuD/methylene tetrahydromethanopterin reductase-like flavin-dependent oxidoreductase (luciferase family)
MRFSTFHLFNQAPGESFADVYAREVEIIEYLERAGFDGVWIAEHHFRDYGTCPNPLSMLAYLAGRTEKLLLGTAIVVLPLHDPKRVVEETALVDLVSSGRVRLGVGRGYQAAEFDAFGLQLSEARERFDECLDIIERAWSGDSAAYQGNFYEVADVHITPEPVQSPHPPIWVAAVSPETVERYAARGLPVMIDPTATFRNAIKAAETWHRTVPSDRADSPLCISRFVHVAESDEAARAEIAELDHRADPSRFIREENAPIDRATGKMARGFEFWERQYMKGAKVDADFRWENQELAGSPERVISQIQQLETAGFGEVICDFGNTRQLTVDESKRAIDRFASQVLPAFKTVATR